MKIKIGDLVKLKDYDMVGEVIEINDGYNTLTVKIIGSNGMTDVWPIQEIQEIEKE